MEGGNKQVESTPDDVIRLRKKKKKTGRAIVKHMHNF